MAVAIEKESFPQQSTPTIASSYRGRERFWVWVETFAGVGLIAVGLSPDLKLISRLALIGLGGLLLFDGGRKIIKQN